jgi:hypothetical protein
LSDSSTFSVSNILSSEHVVDDEACDEIESTEKMEEVEEEADDDIDEL